MAPGRDDDAVPTDAVVELDDAADDDREGPMLCGMTIEFERLPPSLSLRDCRKDSFLESIRSFCCLAL